MGNMIDKKRRGPGQKKKRRDYSQNGSEKNYNKVYAPYNFIPLEDNIIKFSADVKEYSDEELHLIKHNTISDKLYTGEIDYTVTAETPIFIGSGKTNNNIEEFYKNSRGEFAIPGSTMSGVIRANVQVLGASSAYDDIDDYSMMYRYVVGKISRDKIAEYNKILGVEAVKVNDAGAMVNVPTKVKAGYIKEEAGKYYIYKSKTQKDIYNQDNNFYTISEKTILEHPEKYPAILGKNYNPTIYNRTDREGKKHYYLTTKDYKLQNMICVKGEKNREPLLDGEGNIRYEFNASYVPYIVQNVYYKLSSNRRHIVELTNEKKVGYELGCVISTGGIRNKKVLYVIPEKTEERILIPEQEIANFRIDYNKKEKQLKEKAFFNLPSRGEIKPVFYIERKKDEKTYLYFGFTPRLKLFYDNNVKAGVKGKLNGDVDLCKSMFGYSSKKSSYKSKLSFTDAKITRGTGEEDKRPKEYILGQPRASFVAGYLEQDINPNSKNMKDYNDDFSIRGIKNYWLHDELINSNAEKKDKVTSQFRSLEKGAEFKGKIRFNNLTKEEFGLLLWSIKLREDSRMNVGRAKAFGFGRIKMSIDEVNVLLNPKAYGITELQFNKKSIFDKLESKSINNLINEYISFAEGRLGMEATKYIPFESLFAMKDSKKIITEKENSFMSLVGYQKAAGALEKAVDYHKNYGK